MTDQTKLLSRLPVFALLGIAFSIAFFTACNWAPDRSPYGSDPGKAKPATARTSTLEPIGGKPSWAPDIDDRMLAILQRLDSMGGKPIEGLTPAEARKQPTPTDAVMALVRENNIPMPASMVDTMGKDIPVKGGSIHARVYTPKTGTAPFPVIVYFRGGGWVIASLNVYDASCRGLAEQTNAIVVSVDYRTGPEHKFPTAHEDAFAAYQWVLKNAASMNGDPKRVAVAGESAGGNLAANVSIMARDKKIMMPLHQVLVYPVVGDNLEAPSVKEYAFAKPLNKAILPWFFQHYLRTSDDGKTTMMSFDTNLKGLPSTTIIAAELDPLTSGGELLRDMLKKADVSTNYELYKGVTHEFFGMAILLEDAKKAQEVAARDLKKAFDKK